MVKKKFLFTSVVQTENLAKQLAHLLHPPQIIALFGDLGAGKTTFVRAFVSALPHSDNVRVKSPTYALLNTYNTVPTVHHFDLYRLSMKQDFEDLGLWEIVRSDNDFVLIEWPEIINDDLPKNTVRIFFEDLPDEVRAIEVISSDNNINLI